MKKLGIFFLFSFSVYLIKEGEQTKHK